MFWPSEADCTAPDGLACRKTCFSTCFQGVSNTPWIRGQGRDTPGFAPVWRGLRCFSDAHAVGKTDLIPDGRRLSHADRLFRQTEAPSFLLGEKDGACFIILYSPVQIFKRREVRQTLKSMSAYTGTGQTLAGMAGSVSSMTARRASMAVTTFSR